MLPDDLALFFEFHKRMEPVWERFGVDDPGARAADWTKFRRMLDDSECDTGRMIDPDLHTAVGLLLRAIKNDPGWIEDALDFIEDVQETAEVDAE
jgi:hypothetical protein